MIRDWATARGHSLSSTLFYEESHTIPQLNEYDALVIMGGPMGVYDKDKYSWLKAEKQHIRAAIDAGKPVLGVCLGAQLMAASLGAKVAPHKHKEIGWFPVAVLDAAAGHPVLAGLNSAMNVFHWHGDRFEIPQNALHLMSSKACDNQAFLYGRALGLQFHIEMDEEAIEKIIKECAHELVVAENVQDAAQIREKTQKNNTRMTLFNLLDNWLKG